MKKILSLGSATIVAMMERIFCVGDECNYSGNDCINIVISLYLVGRN